MASIGAYPFRALSKAIAPLMGWPLLLKNSPRILLPFYHVVSDVPLPHIRNYRYRSSARFETELDFLLRHYRPVALGDLHSGATHRGPCFHLSFDDGLRQCADVVVPILLRKGIPATFFVNPAFIGNKKLFHRYKASLILSTAEQHPYGNAMLRNAGFQPGTLLQVAYDQVDRLDELAQKLGISFDAFLQQEQPYMDCDQLRHLVEQGFTVGAHSWDHPEFWLLSEADQYQQITQSVDWLRETLNPALSAFAFPYTDSGVSDLLIASLHRDGFCNLTFGTAGVKSDSIAGHWQRFACESKLSLTTSLKQELVYNQMRQLLGRTYVNRKMNGAPPHTSA